MELKKICTFHPDSTLILDDKGNTKCLRCYAQEFENPEGVDFLKREMARIIAKRYKGEANR
jgi:hypothetical protein